MRGSTASGKTFHSYVSLYIRGKDLDPRRVSAALGMRSDKHFSRGERRGATSSVWPHGLWMIESKGRVKSNDPVAHLEWLAKRIAGREDRLRRIVRSGSLDCEISVFWTMTSEHQELVVPAALLHFFGRLGVRVELDLYSPDD